MVSMSDELKERNIWKLILVVRFACATLDVGHPRLKEMEELCVNYYILVSAVFNNMEEVTKVEFQVASRQVLVQFLIHWSHLSPPFSRISVYAVNSLIPVLQLGEIFVNVSTSIALCSIWY
jgi:hypothetical protein